MSVRKDSPNGDDRFGIGTGLIGLGTLLTLVGAVLPWLTVSGEIGEGTSASGLDMISEAVVPIFSPILTVGLAILAVVLALGAAGNDLARAGEMAAGVVITLVAVVFVASPETVFRGGVEGALVGAFTDPGIGLIVTAAGGVAVAAGGAVSLFR